MNGDNDALPFAGSGWESVSAAAAAAAVDDHNKGWEMVASGGSTFDDDDCSVFPPSLHENLTLASPHLQQPAAELLDPSSPPPNREEEKENDAYSPYDRWRPITESARRAVDSGIELVRSRILPSIRRGDGCGGGAAWSFAAVAGFAGWLLYLRRRRRREREVLLFLIREKDQKIAQLMHQIAQLNEIIAARHTVSVMRRS